MFQQITILGPGLLGASLAMAVKQHTLAARVVTWSRRAESRAKCLAHSWCDAVHDSAEAAVAGSDLIVLCTPVQTIVPLLAQIRPALRDNALVTDVGSTKSLICRQARGTLNGHSATFLGSHPMAGSEQTGMEHAQADLFEQAACILTPLDDTPADAIAQLSAFWTALGMNLTAVSPEQHDEIVAHISHLPHLLASSLSSYLATQNHSWRDLAGGGLRDTTRIAAGEPGLWKQILEENRKEVLRAIDGFQQELHHLKAALLNHDSRAVNTLLERGKRYRDQLRKS